jgi:hypothetical protein
MRLFPALSLSAARAVARLRIEPLEERQLFSVAPMDSDAGQGFLSHGGACSCPICAGTIAFSPEMRGQLSASDLATAPLTSLPQLNSLPGSQFTLFLDFDGGYTTGWESNAVYTPPYDFDNNLNSFSTAELNSIREIWARVSEDYAPFNINVTTIDPGNLTDGRTAKIAIGGNYSDWFGDPAGGIAYVGGFSNAASNVGFVFSDALANGVARYVAEAVSHEAGHLFGLWHQSEYNSSGGKTTEYSEGNSQWAPIMGVGYYSSVTTWYNGPNNLGPNVLQDDMAVLSSSSNGFGYRVDEAGNSFNSTTSLALDSNSVTGSGVIGRNTDQDWYRFSTSGGSVSVSATVASVGANLDTVLELRRTDGSLVASASPTSSLSATITASLAAGDYFLVVKSTGVYGYVGQYTLSGTLPAGTSGGGGETGGDTGGSTGGNSGGGISGDGGDSGGGGSSDGGSTDSGDDNSNNNTPTGPEITVLENGTQIVDGGAVSFGAAARKSYVTKTFTIRNDGDSDLLLGQLKNRYLPRGFKLASKISDTVLSAGESTSFSVYMKGKQGAYGGQLVISNNDADEQSFNIGISGTVNSSRYSGSQTLSSAAGNIDVATGLELRSSLPGETAAQIGGRVEAQFSDRVHGANEEAHAAIAAIQGDLHTALANSSLATSDVSTTCLDNAFEAVDELLDELLAA